MFLCCSIELGHVSHRLVGLCTLALQNLVPVTLQDRGAISTTCHAEALLQCDNLARPVHSAPHVVVCYCIKTYAT